jgi:hypothetical protein
MSAQILLSLIAPGLPTAPQGSSGGVAGEFQGLLAGLMGGAMRHGDAEDPVEPVRETGSESEAAVGLVAAPPPPLPVASTPAAGTYEAAVPPAEDAAAPVSASPVVEGVPPTVAAVPAASPAGDASAPPPAAAAALAAADAAPVAPPSGDPPAEADGEAPPPSPTPAAAATAPAPATPAPAAPVVPPPLRALAERTARPLEPGEGSGAATAERPTEAASATTAKAPSTSEAAPGPQSARTGDSPPSALPADPALAGDAAAGGERDPESRAALDSAAPSAREASTPTPLLSRAAVEATAQIAAQILRRLDSRSTRFEMALLPEELGRVDIKLDIDSDGRLAARLAFDNPAAAADLRGRADELRRQLEQAGFHLAEDAFEFAERDSGSSAFDRGDDPRHGSGRAFTAAARLHAEADAAPVARWTSLSLTPAGVDLKV